MFRAITLTLVLLLLSACAAMVTYRKSVDSFIDSTPCCTSMAEFKYEPLPSEEPVTFRLDEKSDSFIFPSGKSYFKAFQLPEKEVPYRIQVKSFALGQTMNTAHIFYPQVALLDGSFTVVKQSDLEDLVVKYAGFMETASTTWGVMLKFERSILVDIPNTKYLVIYTTKELLRKTSNYMSLDVLMTIPIPISGGVFMTPIPLGISPKPIPHSPFGWISITLEPLED